MSGHRLMIAAINLNFTNGATCLFVCEKIVRTIAKATEQRLPLLLIYTNSTETQAQNGNFSPEQILSISAAISGFARENLLYISVLANPNTENRFPGFAYIADIVIAESNVQVGTRVDSQIRRNGAAQLSFKNGMLDMIVSRRELKQTLTDILNFFC